MFYYRIFDDKDELCYFKSSLPYEKIKVLIDIYKIGKELYLNSELIDFFKKEDETIEVITIDRISY
jgi:hypothetical protein